MDEFGFEEWCSNNELSKKVVELLKKENLTSKRSLSLLEKEDIGTFGLATGDRLLLVAAVMELKEEIGLGLGKPQGTTDQLGGLHELLQRCQVNETGLKPNLLGTGQSLHSEPTVYIGPTKGEAALKIVDFIFGGVGPDESEIELSGGATLKLPGAKPKLEKVSPASWGAANMRIFAKLLQEGKLAQEQILDYIAYTIKVSELACRFSWQSVLMYDHEYRGLQAAYGFRWGTDAPHLSTVALRERANIPGQGQSHQQGRGGPGSTGKRRIAHSGREFCLQWNRGSCTFGTRCNYEHACLHCGQRDHAGRDHTGTSQQTASPGQPGASGSGGTNGRPLHVAPPPTFNTPTVQHGISY